MSKNEEDGGTSSDVPNMSLLDITETPNERGIPAAKFVEDITAFAQSFQPEASAELLIGAYSDLHGKYKTQEMQLVQKLQYLNEKVPELEKSLNLVRTLIQKKEEGETATVRYSLADSIYAKAELDFGGTVNLWLGANVMLEYTYDEALTFLTKNEAKAKKELADVKEDLAFLRDQIVTSEVNMSRIFNWDVRRKRAQSKSSTPSS